MEPRTTSSLKGFSLVELLIVLAIIVAITAVVLLSHGTFNRSIIVTNTAYAVALSIREAQSLGLSSRAFSGTSNVGYGVTFARSLPTQYTLFGDISGASPPAWCPRGVAGTPEQKTGNCTYNRSTENVKTYKLGQGFTITDFCGISPTGTRYCSSATLNQLDVVFLRPNTESIITGSSGSGTDGTKVELACAVVWLRAPGASGATRCVVVAKTGQVSVPQTCPATTFTSCP